jgi:hypothetical protein
MTKKTNSLITILPVVLFAVYPVLAMLAHNNGEVLITDTLRALLLSILGALLMVVVLHLLVKDWAKASLITIGLLVLFFAYGQVYDLVRERNILPMILGKHKFLFPIWCLIMGVWVWWVIKKLKKTGELIRYFNVLGIILVLLPLYSIISYQIQDASSQVGTSTLNNTAQAMTSGEKPDIYYIVLDGYGRSNILKELYNYDNSAFIDYLKGKGFYVAEQGTSNYMQTALSLASSMNMEYLDSLAVDPGVDSIDRIPAFHMIKNSALWKFLKSDGYKLVAFQTGLSGTSIRTADYYWSVDTQAVPQVSSLWRFNAFESLLLESTLTRALFESRFLSNEALRKISDNPEYQTHREEVTYILQRLAEPASMPGNYFVFAHIIAPHPPFVFGPNGEDIAPDRSYRLGDGDNYKGDRSEYIKGYRDQAIFIGTQMRKIIDQILSRSKTPPVIIIQGDHGPGAYLVWDSPQKTNLKERFSILNAYYLPGGGEAQLYPGISPVNSFRVVLNQYFGTDYPLLADENFFSSLKRPYDFIRVTDQVKSP